MPVINSDKKFYLVTILLLLVLFVVSLIQNFIKYGHHSSYSIWTTIMYLVVLLLLFIPVLIFSVTIFRRIKEHRRRWYWLLSVCFAGATLLVFYFLSNVLLHSLGFFDGYLDANFARYYFGREALYHLLLITAASFYVFYYKGKRNTIQVYKGRKKITIKLDLVYWIEADGHYLNFYTATDHYIRRERLGVLAKKLSPNFVRIHRKFLVNKDQIVLKEKEKRNEYVVLSSGERLKVGQSFKDNILL